MNHVCRSGHGQPSCDRPLAPTLAVTAMPGIAVGLPGFLLTVADMVGIAPSQLYRSLVLPLATEPPSAGR